MAGGLAGCGWRIVFGCREFFEQGRSSGKSERRWEGGGRKPFTRTLEKYAQGYWQPTS